MMRYERRGGTPWGRYGGTSTRGWSERYQKPWVAWPVAWSAVWVGALTALAAALIIGLIGVALGAPELVPPRRVVRVRDFGFGAGGWVASKITGVRRAESAMLHGAVVWLLAVPLLLWLVGIGR